MNFLLKNRDFEKMFDCSFEFVVPSEAKSYSLISFWKDITFNIVERMFMANRYWTSYELIAGKKHLYW